MTSDEKVRFKTVRRTRLLQHSLKERAKILRELYISNLEALDRAFLFCNTYGIRLYRIPSAIFPFCDTPGGRRVLEGLSSKLALAGERFIQAGIRVVMHPDQFVVLNSDFPATVQNSIDFLLGQADVLDALKQPRTAWAVIEIHGGKSGKADELVRTILTLPESVRSRIALENDEYAYGATEILEICRKSGVPMVFDAHHHVIHEALKSYEDESVGQMVNEARTTWPDPAWQLVHISNGRTRFGDRGHSDYIDVMPSSYGSVNWIEVEAKMKEQAIFKLRAA